MARPTVTNERNKLENWLLTSSDIQRLSQSGKCASECKAASRSILPVAEAVEIAIALLSC